jgi:hypothetical protein
MTFPIDQLLSSIVSQQQCAVCWFVSADDALAKTSTPCPKCGDVGQSRSAYPSGSALKLLNMIQHFRSIAEQHHEDELTRLAAQLSASLSKSVSTKAAYNAYLRMNRADRTSRDNTAVLHEIQKFYRCNQETADAICLIYYSVDLSRPEVTIVPVLAVTLVECLMDELLLDMKGRRQGLPYHRAQKEVNELKSFEQRYEVFCQITGTPFDQEVQRLNKAWWDGWGYTRKRRNLFVHGNPYALGWETCKRAFGLTLNSVSVFAELNNRFVADP